MLNLNEQTDQSLRDWLVDWVTEPTVLLCVRVRSRKKSRSRSVKVSGTPRVPSTKFLTVFLCLKITDFSFRSVLTFPNDVFAGM